MSADYGAPLYQQQGTPANWQAQDPNRLSNVGPYKSPQRAFRGQDNSPNGLQPQASWDNAPPTQTPIPSSAMDIDMIDESSSSEWEDKVYEGSAFLSGVF